MGGNMVRRLQRKGHECVVYGTSKDKLQPFVDEGAVATTSIPDFIGRLRAPRAVWLMVPAAVVDGLIDEIAPLLGQDDVLIDGGNSYYIDDIRRAKQLESRGIHYVDVGTSGGVWGLERGYCLMIGGDDVAVQRLDPIFKSLAPGRDAAPPTPGRRDGKGTADEGYLHCGPVGAGHFVKMVHNGIEYGLMASYAEGLNILKHAGAGLKSRTVDAETSPLRHPEHYQYQFALSEITELWRRGSVVASWLLDLTATSLSDEPELKTFSGSVADSGEGRWTILAAVDSSTPAPVLSAALYQRFTSRGEDDFAGRVLSAMRFQFGGHVERPAGS
jgi:6-phosphogluconate dehydrogenase